MSIMTAKEARIRTDIRIKASAQERRMLNVMAQIQVSVNQGKNVADICTNMEGFADRMAMLENAGYTVSFAKFGGTVTLSVMW